MLRNSLTYFFSLSVAAHASLFGLWPESDHMTSYRQESSIEIGLVMLPTIEKDFRQERVQAQNTAPAPAPTPNVAPPSKAAPKTDKKPIETTDSAPQALAKVETVEYSAEPSPEKPTQIEKPSEPDTHSAETGSNPATATRAAPLHSENPAPVYPAKALRYGWEGDVWLKVDVNRNGLVDTISVDRSSGYPVLDRAAIRTVRKWLFEPARIGPEPTDGSVRVPVRFKIKRT